MARKARTPAQKARRNQLERDRNKALKVLGQKSERTQRRAMKDEFLEKYGATKKEILDIKRQAKRDIKATGAKRLKNNPYADFDIDWNDPEDAELFGYHE